MSRSSNSITPQGDGNSHSSLRRACNRSNSITPQGDGNDTLISPMSDSVVVQIPLPRKGTETMLMLSPCSLAVFVQIPLPRKGTETDNLHSGRCRRYRFKFHYPARGRKPLYVAFKHVTCKTVQILGFLRSLFFPLRSFSRMPFLLPSPFRYDVSRRYFFLCHLPSLEWTHFLKLPTCGQRFIVG